MPGRFRCEGLALLPCPLRRVNRSGGVPRAGCVRRRGHPRWRTDAGAEGFSIYQGVTIGRCCFIGPHTIFTNDLVPRVGVQSWRVVPTTIEDGASLGAGVIVRSGVSVGAFALVGTGSVVTRDVPAFHMVYGLPARPRQRICACGKTQSPLRWPVRGVLNCCYEHLLPEVLALALIEEQCVLKAAA